MRRTLIVGAQKLYLHRDDSKKFAQRLVKTIRDKQYSFDIAVCPSFINISDVSDILRGSNVGIGAQNVHQEDSGAFTGQVSIQELLSLGVKYIIVGHSELRNQQGETNGMVNKKIKTCLKHDVVPIACIGENYEERQAGRSKEIIELYIRDIFKDISEDTFKLQNIVIAYEPIWAIKGGRDDKNTAAASPEIANDMHEFIRDVIATIYSRGIAEKIRIIYGGSVNSENTGILLKEPSIDGLLIGTASIVVESFLKILEAAEGVVSYLKNSGQLANVG